MKRLAGVGIPALVVLLLALVVARASAGPRATFLVSPTMKILVDKDGWYRVPQATLTGAGFVFPSDPNLLHVSTGGQDVPFQLRSGVLEFYGQGLDTLVTDTRTYWLSVGATPGLIMQSARVRAPAAAPLSSFTSTLNVEDQLLYSLPTINGNKDNFFGDDIRPTKPVNRVINVPNVDTTQPATLSIELQGFNACSHTINVSLNGTPLGTLSWFGVTSIAAAYTLESSPGVGSGPLNNGSNTVSFTDSSPVCTPQAEISVVDTYDFNYQHLAMADGDKIGFPVTPAQARSIDGFSTGRVRVLDITNPVVPRELFPAIEQTGGDFTIHVMPPAGSSRLYAFEDAQALAPKAVVQDVPSTLATPGNQADLVIISHKNFLSPPTPIQPLINLRTGEGLQVFVADIEDVYDEFSFGNKDQNAIRSFLQYAKNNWAVGPDYALFVGDATYDPRNYLNLGNFDFVPTNLVDATFTEAPSDDSLADFNGDGSPELGVGRLPVRTTAEATAVVSKIVNYANTAPTPRSAVMVSDNFDRGDYHFDQFSDDLRNTLITNGVPPGSITSIYRPDGATSASDTATHNTIMTAASNNPTIVNWFGHGAIQNWAGSPSLLRNADGPLLTNTQLLSLYLMMTCQNAYFVGPNFNGLGEALLLRQTPTGAMTPNAAVAVWGSSGDTVPADQVNAAKTAMQVLLTNPSARLGDAMVAAKAAISDIDVKHTWNLLGDPTTKLK